MRVVPFPPEKYPLQHAKTYRNQPIAFTGEMFEQYGDVFGMKFGGRNLYISSNPDHAQHTLQTAHRQYIKATSFRRLKILLGDGLFTSEGEHWLNQRRQIQPKFQKDHLTHFAEIMQETTEQMLYRWQYFYAGKRACNLLEEMSECTLEIVCESLLGQKLEGGGSIINEELPPVLRFLIRRLLNPIPLPLWVPTPAHRKFKMSVRKISGLITALLFEKKVQDEALRGDDLLTLLMHSKDVEGNSLSNQQIIDEVLTFFLAGHETSAVAMTWAFYELCRHPEVEEKLRAEISDVTGNRPFQVADLASLTYTEYVCKEVLRMYPPAWTTAREAIDDHEMDGYTVNKGDTVVTNMFWLHRHPDFWEKPSEFLPDRWMEPNVPSHKFAYAPFGGGPRQCIGNHFAMTEMKILLVNVLQNFKLKIVSEPEGFDCALTLRPLKDVMLELQPLKNNWTLAKGKAD